MCEMCRQIPCNTRCPNYVPPNAEYYCSICDGGIYEGEEYIKNDNDEYAHYECINTSGDMAEFLGYDIETMEMNDEGYY